MVTFEYGAYDLVAASRARARSSSHAISSADFTYTLYTLRLFKNFRFSPVVVSDEVGTALKEGRGVVALESSIIAQGLPTPVNLVVAQECESAVREGGSTPATIAVLDGRVVVGLNASELERLSDPSRHVAKLSSRDLGLVIAAGSDGATTIAGTITVAKSVGIDVMATGGLGGVHRDANVSYDESADLITLSRNSMLVVASGVKSILDIGATLERLDTLGVAVVGYRTFQFPGFYLRDSGFSVDWSVESVDEAAAAFVRHREFSMTSLIVANPVAIHHELDRHLHDEALESALTKVHLEGVRGNAVSPTLLTEFARHTDGVSAQVNRDLVVANAGLAGAIATSLARTLA
jgi:pseudouridine-5'-phosphate glycosidase